jgi:hypothetical protein
VENERNNFGVLEAYDNRQVKQVFQGLTEVGIRAYTKPRKEDIPLHIASLSSAKVLSTVAKARRP